MVPGTGQLRDREGEDRHVLVLPRARDGSPLLHRRPLPEQHRERQREQQDAAC